MKISPCTLIRPNIAGPKTVLVLGVFRGGTSFIAKVLHDLGVPMGHRDKYGVPMNDFDNPDYCNFEDALLWQAMQDGRWDLLPQLVAGRNQQDTWGFKWPGTVFRLNRFLPLLRNPHLIAVFRDPAAIFQGEVARGFRAAFGLTAAHLARVAAVADDPPCPMLAVSYERARKDVGGLRQSLSSFLGDSIFETTDISKLELDSCEYLSPESQATSEANLPNGSSPTSQIAESSELTT